MANKSKTLSRRQLLTGRLFRQVTEDLEDRVEERSSLKSAAKQLRPAPPTVETPSYLRPSTPSYVPVSTPSVPVLRPPTAQSDELFQASCDGCQRCIKACPYGALLADEEGADKPRFKMEEEACRLCSDMPCVEACPTEALSMERSVKIGRAYLKIMNCLSTTGSFCSVCVERCPLEGAISMLGGRPQINAQSCVGCGQCVYSCPAPSRALIIMPS